MTIDVEIGSQAMLPATNGIGKFSQRWKSRGGIESESIIKRKTLSGRRSFPQFNQFLVVGKS